MEQLSNAHVQQRKQMKISLPLKFFHCDSLEHVEHDLVYHENDLVLQHLFQETQKYILRFLSYLKIDHEMVQVVEIHHCGRRGLVYHA